MSVTTTYKCDRCGSEQNNHKDFWMVGLVVRVYQGSTFISTNDVTQQQHWCRKCCEKHHILPRVMAKAEEILPEKPTLEQLIREIVQEELGNT